MAEADGPGDAAGSGDRGGAPDTGLSCLALLRFHGMAADPAQLAHEYAPASGGVDLPGLTRAAREQGLKAGVRRLALRRLDRAALPAIAEAADGTFFVLAKADGEKVLVQRPGAPPETLDHAALAACWTGRVLLLAWRAQPAAKRRAAFAALDADIRQREAEARAIEAAAAKRCGRRWRRVAPATSTSPNISR